MKTQELIEKAAKIRLDGFPESDYDKIEELLNDNNKIEVWLEKGMGRKYLIGCLPDKHFSHPPLQERLCELDREILK